LKQFIEKHHKIFATIGSVIIIGIIASGLIFGPFNEILPDSIRVRLGYDSPSVTDQELIIRLFVDFGTIKDNINQTIIFKANETATAYSILLQANLTVEIDQYPNGIFVLGIEGVTQNSEHYWQYLVDDVAGNIASDRFDLNLNNAQKVSWLYK